MTREKWFPIQAEHPEGRGPQGPRHRPAGQVPWGVAQGAHEQYVKWFGDEQSLEQLAERGGFGWSELVGLLAGDREFRQVPFGEPSWAKEGGR